MMKRLLFFFILIAMMGGAVAQVYLSDVLKPTDEKRYTPFTSKDKAFCIARYPYRGGFRLTTGLGGLISSDNPGGHAVFNLGGAYDKLSFVMGPYGGEYHGSEFEDLIGPNSAGDGSNVIVTVRADGRALLDEVVWNHDAPREVVLDVKGVKELRFDVMRGSTELAVGAARLWKAGQTVTPAPNPLKLPTGKAMLVKDLWPHYIRHSGWVAAITDRTNSMGCHIEKSISINRVTYNTGLQFSLDQALIGTNTAWAYFWLQKRYGKVSFIVGPRDNQSSQAMAWLTVKADGKIIYEKLVKQTDLAEQVVLDVKNVNQLSFHGSYAESDFLGSITYGVTNITAWPEGSADVPAAGEVNGSKERISKLPDVCAMCSNIPPYSVRGVSAHKNTYFDGATRHYTFSMGGEKFWEGFILTTGTTLFDDNINSYAAFDLAGEYDYMTFTAGCLTNHRVLADDIIRVYADDKLILETTIHATWPNQRFELPLNRCRILKFVKPGTGESKQVYFGIADVVLYRGSVVPNDLFVHDKPDCPETADLIDLCQRPYFHYVGRYLSSMTNFDFNDCFKNGSSQREYFQMKDGSKIYKGIMLETNVPPIDLENMTISKAFGMMFLPVYGMAVIDEQGHQSSVAAFNPYREYETVTFTVANKSEYVDEFDKGMWGNGQAPPVQLYVYADREPVAEIVVDNKMSPTTYTVPIHKCEQLMFWLKCGDVRSGQYVIYDITVDKRVLPPSANIHESLTTTPAPAVGQTAKPATATTAATATATTAATTATTVQSQETQETQSATGKTAGKTKKEKAPKPKKEKPLVEWPEPAMSGNSSMDTYLKAVNEVWRTNKSMQSKAASGYEMKETYVRATDGTIYKAVSFVDQRGTKLSISSIIEKNEQFEALEANITLKAVDADLSLPAASLSVPNLGEKMFEYGKYIRLGTDAVSQCRRQAAELVNIKKMENDVILGLQARAVAVDGVQSTDKILFVPLLAGETVPEGVAAQSIRFFKVE